MAPSHLQLTFDEALTHHVGEFGRGQRRVVVLASFFGLPNGLVFLLWVFLSIDPIKSGAWRCVSPTDAACSAVLASPHSSSSFCQLPRDSWEWTSLDSVVAQFNLICSESWKVQFTNSLMFIGCFFGSGLFGAVSDKVGRRLPLFAATALSAAATFVSTAAPSYWFIAVARLIVGVGAAGMVQGIYLVCTETTGPSFRGQASVLQTIFFSVGQLVLVAIAFLAPAWRTLTIAAGAITAAPLLLFPLIPESARWLLSQGNQEKATSLLRNLSISNGSKMPDGLVLCHSSSNIAKQPGLQQGGLQRSAAAASSSSLHADGGAASEASDGSVSGDVSRAAAAAAGAAAAAAAAGSTAAATAAAAGSTAAAAAAAGSSEVQLAGFTELLRVPKLAVMSLVLLLTWFTNFFSYYGIALGVGGLPGSIYITFTLGAVAELVAYLLACFLVDRVGRHNIVSLGLLLGGTACLVCGNTGGQAAQMALSAVGKFGFCCSLSVTPTYTAELYPTHIRSRALGIFNQACRCGSIAAPFMLLLGSTSGMARPLFIPFMAMGTLALAAGAMLLLMPETLGLSMIETVEDLQQLQTIFSAKPWSKGLLATVAFLFRTRGATAAAAASSGHSQPDDELDSTADITAICSDVSTAGGRQCGAGKAGAGVQRGQGIAAGERLALGAQLPAQHDDSSVRQLEAMVNGESGCQAIQLDVQHRQHQGF